MYHTQASASNDGSGLVLCLVIFFILMLLFRGVQNRRNCVVYQSPPPPVSYAERPLPRPATAANTAKAELGSPPTLSRYGTY